MGKWTTLSQERLPILNVGQNTQVKTVIIATLLLNSDLPLKCQFWRDMSVHRWRIIPVSGVVTLFAVSVLLITILKCPSLTFGLRT